MQNTPTQTVFDVLTDFLASEPTKQELLDYHLPDDLQARVDALVEKNGEGQLTFDEQQELYDFTFLCINDFVSEFTHTDITDFGIFAG